MSYIDALDSPLFPGVLELNVLLGREKKSLVWAVRTNWYTILQRGAGYRRTGINGRDRTIAPDRVVFSCRHWCVWNAGVKPGRCALMG